MQDNRHLFPIRREDAWTSISAAIYLALIFGLVQAWVHLSDAANAFISLQ